MRSLLLASLVVLLSSCLVRQINIGFPKKHSITEQTNERFASVFDMNVQRLSGSRVQISWHSQAAEKQRSFEVMRKIGKGIFTRIAVISPQGGETIGDYSLTDINPYADSSFYAIRRRDNKGAYYLSAPVAVGGKGR